MKWEEERSVVRGAKWGKPGYRTLFMRQLRGEKQQRRERIYRPEGTAIEGKRRSESSTSPPDGQSETLSIISEYC